MPTIMNFKDILDLPEWRPLALAPSADGAGRSLACDLRNNEDRHPEIFHLASNTSLSSYSAKNDGWTLSGSPTLAGTFGAGAAAVFAPQRGPRGTLAAGCTPTTLVLASALPGAVGPNQLADRGDGRGFKVRVIGKSVGKTEERLVVANSGGTTPTVVVDSPLSFSPAASDEYEFLAGRVYMLGAGTVAAGIWKYYDLLTCTFSGNLSVTNLPTSIGTNSSMICRDELYVPANRQPGEGFFGQMSATGTGSTSLSGQASGGDAAVLANEYRNFQIRIITDSVNPTAVGQRRKITSHTAGPGPIYTVPAWTVTPSAQAIFVIEETNEILLWTSASTTTYTYAQDAIAGGQTADSWATATYAARPAAIGAGVSSFQSFGLNGLDAAKNARYSNIFSFRGAASRVLDVLDLSGGANGLWTADSPYGGASSSGPTFTTGTCVVYDPVANGGRYAYVLLNSTNSFYRFNVLTRTLQPWAQLRFPQGTAYASQKLALCPLIDGDQKLSFLYTLRSYGTELFHCLLQR